MYTKIKNFILELLFPRFCFGCQREGDYLCQDCLSLLEISGFHKRYSTKNLADLYFALPYQNPLIRNLIQKFKYEIFIKELAISLASLIITHFQLIENPPPFFGGGFILIPVPLEKNKLKWRGFNQAEEIGRELSKFLEIPLFCSCLIKIKETLPQIELSDEERKENVKGAFLVNPVRKEWRIWDPVRNCWFSNGVKNEGLVKNKKILLVDDVYTTGATMEECARVLKKAGAKEIIGIVIARG